MIKFALTFALALGLLLAACGHVPPTATAPGAHRVVAFDAQSGASFLQSDWAYEDVELRLSVGEEPFEVNDADWTCFRTNFVTMDIVIELLVSHGDQHQICFYKLVKDNWNGPVE